MAEDFRAVFQELVRKFGLLAADRTPCGTPMPPSDAHALMCLLAAGEAGLLQTALVAQLGIDKSTASRLIGRMAERGHVEAVADSEDQRARPVRLTKQGVRVASELDRASARRFASVLEHLPARRRGPVVAALRDLVDALDRLDSTESDSDEA